MKGELELDFYTSQKGVVKVSFRCHSADLLFDCN